MSQLESDPSAPATSSWPSMAALGLGVAVTLSVYGYQFGRGNHGVYLLDALRRVDPRLLANDWFTTQTLQYHVAFSELSAILMRLGIIQPAFLAIYGLLAILLHVAWRGIVAQQGGGDGAYLLSVVLYHLCAAGTGLGMYQFLQDSSLLPSNIANIALLWAMWLWIGRRYTWAGACVGIAGIFHLNFALVGSGLWVALMIWPPWTRDRRAILIGTMAAIIPSAINIAVALQLKLARSGSMPLTEFVDLYVRLRHPHHYDPSAWPAGIWIMFILPAAAAVILLRGQARRIVLIPLGLILVALLGAGVWYVSETLAQMSLYRFSIYVQLFGCAAAAGAVARWLRRPRMLAIAASAGCGAMIIACAIRGPFFGAFYMPRDTAAYVAMCEWVEGHTPVDAILLVPPEEESMRLLGRRAIVVNYKCVPQLSGELSQWRQRMCDVLDLPNLNSLPRGYTQILPAIADRYELLSADQLLAIARKYNARYIVSTHPLQPLAGQAVYGDARRRYYVYDAARSPAAP